MKGLLINFTVCLFIALFGLTTIAAAANSRYEQRVISPQEPFLEVRQKSSSSGAYSDLANKLREYPEPINVQTNFNIKVMPGPSSIPYYGIATQKGTSGETIGYYYSNEAFLKFVVPSGEFVLHKDESDNVSYWGEGRNPVFLSYSASDVDNRAIAISPYLYSWFYSKYILSHGDLITYNVLDGGAELYKVRWFKERTDNYIFNTELQIEFKGSRWSFLGLYECRKHLKNGSGFARPYLTVERSAFNATYPNLPMIIKTRIYDWNLNDGLRLAQVIETTTTKLNNIPPESNRIDQLNNLKSTLPRIKEDMPIDLSGRTVHTNSMFRPALFLIAGALLLTAWIMFNGSKQN